MNNNWFWLRQRRMSGGSKRAALFLAVGLLTCSPLAHAGVPDWLRAAARTSLPDYPEDTAAVMLLNEQATTVTKAGEIKTRHRRAYKILRAEGRGYGTVVVDFDQETRLTFLRGWSLPARGKPHEVREKDAVETGLSEGILYQDTRRKAISIPGTDPGSVIGYEYERKGRPFILQDSWRVAREIPVRRARYALQLPAGWEVDARWVNHAGGKSKASGKNRSVWELEDIAAIEREPAMPHWRAVAARLLVSFYPAREDLRQRAHRSWSDVGRWYGNLTRGRRQASPEIRQKVAELTEASPTLLDKIKALAVFAQRDIRYVAIEIGIGGYQPHPAREVFGNLYGDCKDKATLLGAMLREVGVESHYVLVHSRRGVVTSEAPSVLSFNHVIVAVELPSGGQLPALYAAHDHERLGRLLFFDPTDPMTPLGYLPPTLQAGRGLLVGDDGGELVELPLLPPALNRLLRNGKFSFTEDGSLRGSVREIRSGDPAVSRRSAFLRVAGPERQKVLEDFLVGFLGGFRLLQAQVENLEEYDRTLVVDYKFVGDNYSKAAGKLRLFKPWVLGRKSGRLLEEEDRQHPVEFPSTTSQSDMFDITLPSGYLVEELPPAVTLTTDFAEYRSKVELEGDVLRCRRNYLIKAVRLPAERVGELNDFHRRIAADERSQVVLKRLEAEP